MSDKKTPLKVFLCHATADKPQVRKLYNYLKRRGIQPWFDIVDLLPGQDWQVEIPKVIASSDVIIVCLSDNSVDKEGYVQKEIKFALDKALEMPDGHIFLIPARLNNCDVPFSLNKYQWVDIFEEDGYSRLLNSLKLRASQLERKSIELLKAKESAGKSISKAIKEKPNKPADRNRKGTGDVGIGRNVSGSVIVVGNGNVINFDTQSISNAKSNKIPPNKKAEFLGKEPELELRNGSRERFLDALDSARFSFQATYDDSRLLSVLYVKAQLFFAMVTGDSIVVTENQFFDSLGFLEAFYELHNAVQAVGFEIDLPIKVALRATNDSVYQAVANNIGNVSFVLTLWKDLDRDIERRKLWAEYIGKKQKPIDEIVFTDEKQLLDKLWTALEYFNQNRCVSADNIPAEFSKRIKKIVEMKDDDLDDLYAGKSKGVPQRKYFSTSDEIKAAKEIRDAMIEIQGRVGDIKTRSIIRRELSNFKEELREGVIELTDGIYNQTLGIATRAKLIQSSTFPPRRNKYVTAGYSMSIFVQDTSNSLNYYMNWEIFSFDYFKDLEALDLNDLKRKTELIQILDAARKNTPWNRLFELQSTTPWKKSLEKFQDSLAKLQSVVKVYSIGSTTNTQRRKLEKERQVYQKSLEKYWIKHIANVSKITDNIYWNITPDELSFHHPDIHYPIRMTYGFLKTKIDMAGDGRFENWRNSSAFKGHMDSGG